MAKIDDITKKYDEVMKKTSEQEETIKFLLQQFQSLSRQTIGAVKEITQHIEAESRETSGMEVENKDEEEVENKDECYEIYCDEQYKDIVRKQATIASNMDEKLKEIRKNLKSKKVEETLESLSMLDKSVMNEKNEMMKIINMDIRYTLEYKNENERNFDGVSMTASEIEQVLEDPSDPNMEEMFEQLKVMFENIEKIPKNNFKRN